MPTQRGPRPWPTRCPSASLRSRRTRTGARPCSPRRADTDPARACWRGVARRDDEAEMAIEAGAAQNRDDLVAQCARGDAERQAGGRAARRRPAASGYSTSVDAEHLVEDHGLCADERRRSAGRPRLAARRSLIARNAADVVEPEVVAGSTRRVRASTPSSREHCLVRPQVQRLGVGEHAVEVEDDGADHRPVRTASRRPGSGLQPVLARRDRAFVLGIEDAERVIGAVEVEIVDAAARPVEIEVAAALIGLAFRS